MDQITCYKLRNSTVLLCLHNNNQNDAIKEQSLNLGKTNSRLWINLHEVHYNSKNYFKWFIFEVFHSTASFFVICIIFRMAHACVLTRECHATSDIKYSAAHSCCLHRCRITSWLWSYSIPLLEQTNSPISRQKKFVKLRNIKMCNSPGRTWNSTPMDVSFLTLVHHVVKRTIQVKARRNSLLVSYDAMPPYGGCGS